MHVKSRTSAVAAATLLMLSVTAAPVLTSSKHDVIRADLVPSLPTSGTVNGLPPGAAPWVLDRGEVRVRDDGRMDVRLEGCQVPRPDGTRDNPVASITVVLYCAGTPVADSGPQELSVPGGDARFPFEDLSIPRECDAPSVLVSPTAAVGRAYIASTSASGRGRAPRRHRVPEADPGRSAGDEGDGGAHLVSVATREGVPGCHQVTTEGG